MPFVSYAQNFEDVTLWRALRDVDRGFYIDVGAWDPDQDSVTRGFSERGWHGINIEPLATKHALLQARRPHDINLAVAAGASAGNIDFFEVTGTGLSTTNATLAMEHAERGFQVTQQTMPQITLAKVCLEHAPSVIHFLKVDCEGQEHAVLAGADFTRYRPWIVLVEATVPMTQRPAFEEWEPLLLEAGYRFTWFDGLNRFYVVTEHFARLAPLIAVPPSCFDDFVRALDLAAAMPPAHLALVPPGSVPVTLPVEQRIELATRCRDCDDIPKVEDAGRVLTEADGTRVQIMHNGLRVPADEYCGAWMTELIRRCRGHHEPQEERQFHAAVQALSPDATMIELGGNWSYYTAWFLLGSHRRRAVVLEPDPANRAAGQRTMALNDLHATFVEGFAGATPTPPAPFQTERSGVLPLPCLSVPQLLATHGMDQLDILHCDTQGAELKVLEGCQPLFRAGKIGWVFVSTHVPQISGDALTHHRCLDLLRGSGAAIVAEHDPWESFSGDGLIVARFGAPSHKWNPAPLTVARRREALFRDPCHELAGAMASAAETDALLEEVVSGTFQHLLFRNVGQTDLAQVVAHLKAGGSFGAWLRTVLDSPEFERCREQFGKTYWRKPEASVSAALLLPAGSPVSLSTV